jgi:3-deoxy-D-arabino-heptulosonate 7-phosphate synthase|nr:MAG TPA: protein of unknown function (DUF4376) [Caudoviricetes sp.]
MLIEKVVEEENIYLVNDELFVPKADDNGVYQEILKWIKAGNKPIKREKSLEALKLEKLNELQNWAIKMTDKSAINLKGFGVIDGGYKYLLNVRAMKNNYEALPQKVFRMYDNSFKEVNLTDLEKIEKAIELGGIMLHTLKWQYETAISKAKNKEELEAITFNEVIEIDKDNK